VRRVHDAWKATASRAANARYTNIPTSGHQMPFDAPDAVVAAVVDVLDAVEQQAGGA
jgi:pimeloyl-ACP methyl ester carboxylesterase